MNGNDLENKVSENNTYRATSNFNTAIENPQINMNSAVDINIKDVVSSNDIYNVNLNNSVPNNFNNNFSNNDTTSNFNITTNNPQFNMNNVNEVNINDNNSNRINDINFGGSQFIPNNNLVNNVSNEDNSQYGYVPVDDDAVYEPVMQENKKKEKFVIPRELKVMIFIVFILFVFILVTPYIYDFFREIKLSMTG